MNKIYYYLIAKPRYKKEGYKKPNIVEKLEKYFKMPNIHLQFSTLPKLGINPKFDYKNPIGIYTYPLIHYKFKKEVFNKLNNKEEYSWDMRRNYKLKALERIFPLVPAYSKYILIIKANLTKEKSYTQNNYSKDMEKLQNIAEEYAIPKEYFKIILMTGKASNKQNTPFSEMWNVSRLLSLTIAKFRIPSKRSLFSTFLDFFKSKEAIKYRYFLRQERISKVSVKIWNKLLRKIGYYGFEDTSGILHENEPKQSVILNMKYSKLIDIISLDEIYGKEGRYRENILNILEINTYIENVVSKSNSKISKTWVLLVLKEYILKDMKAEIIKNYKPTSKDTIEVQDAAKYKEDLFKINLTPYFKIKVNTIIEYIDSLKGKSAKNVLKMSFSKVEKLSKL
jgi:hypothetical protein